MPQDTRVIVTIVEDTAIDDVVWGMHEKRHLVIDVLTSK